MPLPPDGTLYWSKRIARARKFHPMSWRKLIIAIMAAYVLADQAVTAPSAGRQAIDLIQIQADSEQKFVAKMRSRSSGLTDPAAASAVTVTAFLKTMGLTFSNFSGKMASYSVPKALSAQSPPAGRVCCSS